MNHSTLMVEMEKLALKNINYWHKVFIHIMGHESKHWYTTETCAQSTECSTKLVPKSNQTHIMLLKKKVKHKSEDIGNHEET